MTKYSDVEQAKEIFRASVDKAGCISRLKLLTDKKIVEDKDNLTKARLKIMKELQIYLKIYQKVLKSNYDVYLSEILETIKQDLTKYLDEFVKSDNAETKISVTSETKELKFFSLAEISFAFANYKGNHTELTNAFNGIASVTNFFDNLDQEQSSLVKLHFLSQLMHESQRGKYTTELADGSVYEGSKILGNVETGDGKKFKGRGFIQLTGRDNYTRFSQWLATTKIDVENSVFEKPHIVANDVRLNVLSAFWYWQSRNITEKALEDNVYTVTKKINGGTNGLTQRSLYYQMLKKFMKEGL